jgi:predicted glycogen debranching enzyme
MSLPAYDLELEAGRDRFIGTEWLLADGLGGFAMGTVAGVPTRRYHGLLVASMAPPVQREVMLHSVVDALVIDPGGASERRIELSSFRFRDCTHPRGYELIAGFVKDTACRWTYRAGPVEIVKTVRLLRGRNAVAVTYRVKAGATMLRLEVRPLVAMRDAHSLLRKAACGHEFSTDQQGRGVRVSRRGRELLLGGSAGCFDTEPQWWYNFSYDRERERGYEHEEDLFSPGVFSLQVRPGKDLQLTIEASVAGAAAGEVTGDRLTGHVDACLAGLKAEASEENRRAIAGLAAAADDFVVRRGEGGAGGVSIIAGYPWFSDWGRDAMVSLPGLLLCTGRHAEARHLLDTFARKRRRGLIPNLFNDWTGEAEYNTVDASLWFLHAACEYLRVTGDRRGFGGEIRAACLEIIQAYRAGTDDGIGMDPADGLIAAGNASTQLTWMDARRDGTVFTPRHGKPVEVNALWHHGLLSVAEAIAPEDAKQAAELRAIAHKTGGSFRVMFWNPVAACCHDVLTPVGGGAWRPDSRVRPNQIFAASLRHSPLGPAQRQSVVRCVQKRLLTPHGVRTLDPADPGYKGRYAGSMWERDAAYHNGTAWPWLVGPLAEAVLRVGEFSPASRAQAVSTLAPLAAYLDKSCLGQLPEVFDGDDSPERPQHPGGCPAQAWSVAETLRVYVMALSK